MKTIKYILSILTISLFLTSCDWLEPETNPTNQIFQIAAKLVYDPSGENIFLTDDNLKLFPANKITIPENQKDTFLNQRYFISFQIAEESQLTNPNQTNYTINLLSMQLMREENIIKINSDDAMSNYKNEQLTIQHLWCSGQYLNIITQVAGSGSKIHNYHLFYNDNISKDTLYLTLRYDNNNDTKSYTIKQALYYNLKDYINNQKDSTTICFNYNSGYLEYNTIYLKFANK